jgi:hypothetical protein
MAKIIKKCKQCGKIFSTYQCWDNIFCSEYCYFTNSSGKKRGPQEKKRFQQICLGMNCRGKKKFLTTNKHNRICYHCSLLMKGYADIYVA